MARVMAFDYGTKRIGIAITDPLQLISTSLTTIHPKDIIAFLKNYLQAEEVALFVIGEPKRLNNEHSDVYGHVKGFANLLKKHFPTIQQAWYDERFTSKMASNTIAQMGMSKKKRENKALVDQTSATIILQSYMAFSTQNLHLS